MKHIFIWPKFFFTTTHIAVCVRMSMEAFFANLCQPKHAFSTLSRVAREKEITAQFLADQSICVGFVRVKARKDHGGMVGGGE